MPDSNAEEPPSPKPEKTSGNRFLMADLCEMLETYLEVDQVKQIYVAYLFSAEAHEGQLRKSGEPYIYHPVAVAQILAELRMDTPTIIAALLHDVLEDTAVTKAQLIDYYGEHVAELVDGVSKLPKTEDQKIESEAETEEAEPAKRVTPDDERAANFRKMIMAMTKDIRVIVLKLADRLHNMRTLGHKSGPSQRRIARETLEIYAPLAGRLGISKLSMELEDLCFKTLYPHREAAISDYIKRQTHKREEWLNRITDTVRERLHDMGIQAEVSSRTKRSYSFYLKMASRIRRHDLPHEKKAVINSIKDIFGLRIIVDDVDNCYRALGIIHNLYSPKPGQFKDYIAIPKRNGYQSLHTMVIHTSKISMEVQIRARDMDDYAEYGIATHGLYKSKEHESSSFRRKTTEWLRNLQEIQENARSHKDFLESVKEELFPDEIFVLTPRGDVIELKRNATAVDFAYAIHSDVGNKMIAAKVNDVLLDDLGMPLRTGQTVEVITTSWARPKLYWLDFVATKKAREGIRNFFKNLQREEAIEMGKRMLDRELEPFDLSVDILSNVQRNSVLATFNKPSISALLEDIGLGKRMALTVSRQLFPVQEGSAEAKALADAKGKPLIVKGTEGFLVSLGNCCHPIPGDVIKGYVSTGRGIVIHTTQCKNTQSSKYKVENWIDLSWADQLESEFPVDIRLDVKNQPGVLGTIANTTASIGINIDTVYTEAKGDNENTSLRFSIKVRDRKHLAEIEQRLHRLAIVHRVYRVK
jgi:RelA/SpoT family (p)ppGpp synthetase